ncbi:hypothetical protein L1N85_21030 [Paenibacillus alkaliterrae]|nr:hypothetical protein [Paenibacillus alkaliterrae]MCF2940876.1 hypothetical protein [Paenibacillus alkaliterrae]
MKEELKETTNSMAPTVKEMVKLGKDMDKMKTNTEIIENGMIPDPKQ